ncbi:MAG: AAA family ATPase [Deltaproteobacteria bacterium]|nr:AAA family ATPase [Deltaproteobacteria bacterium]
MLKNDLVVRNPLNILGDSSRGFLPAGGLGAISSRAGVGKTSLLIQIAVIALLQKKNVLHVSFEEPVRKVNLWYKEVVGDLARQYQVDGVDSLWEQMLPHRFIMTFPVDGFTVERLEERVRELADQDIFVPDIILVDGLPFAENGLREQLKAMKDLVERLEIHAWFTVRTHRHQGVGEDGMPVQLQEVRDLFAVILMLQPEGKEIYIKVLKGMEEGKSYPDLCLDPETMLVKTS